jgi:hypothetical protein
MCALFNELRAGVPGALLPGGRDAVRTKLQTLVGSRNSRIAKAADINIYLCQCGKHGWLGQDASHASERAQNADCALPRFVGGRDTATMVFRTQDPRPAIVAMLARPDAAEHSRDHVKYRSPSAAQAGGTITSCYDTDRWQQIVECKVTTLGDFGRDPGNWFLAPAFDGADLFSAHFGTLSVWPISGRIENFHPAYRELGKNRIQFGTTVGAPTALVFMIILEIFFGWCDVELRVKGITTYDAYLKQDRVHRCIFYRCIHDGQASAKGFNRVQACQHLPTSTLTTDMTSSPSLCPHRCSRLQARRARSSLHMPIVPVCQQGGDCCCYFCTFRLQVYKHTYTAKGDNGVVSTIRKDYKVADGNRRFTIPTDAAYEARECEDDMAGAEWEEEEHRDPPQMKTQTYVESQLALLARAEKRLRVIATSLDPGQPPIPPQMRKELKAQMAEQKAIIEGVVTLTGIQGMSAFRNVLPYWREICGDENGMCWDLMHILNNVGRLLLDMLHGKSIPDGDKIPAYSLSADGLAEVADRLKTVRLCSGLQQGVLNLVRSGKGGDTSDIIRMMSSYVLPFAIYGLMPDG